MTKKYLDRVDAIRGLAILLVLSYHTLLCLYPNYEAKTYSDNGILIISNIKTAFLNFNPIGQGWIGVELFLVISGFLIHFIYLQTQNEFKWNAFFSKRFWRIYPPYFIVLLFFFIKRIDLSQSGLIDFFSHVFLIHNLSDKTFFSLNPSFWSIALEVQLYLIYPIYIVLIKYLGSKKTTILLLLTTILFCIIAYQYNIHTLSFGTFVLNFWFTWATGAFLADRYYQNKRLFKKPFIWFSLFYILFFVFKLFHFTSSFILIPATLSCLALMEVILYGNFVDKFAVNKRIFKLLSYIGLISYSIYLIHQPYLNDLLNFYNPGISLPHLNNFVKIAFTYITIFLISYSLHKIIELKSIEYGKYIRKR
jgi:peptidoglycan/LPS O-acetylase OafA/YrhL